MMNRMLMSGLYFLASKLMQGVGSSAGTTEELTRLKLATVYLHAVRISRLLCISLLGSGACLILLFIGLLLIHMAVFYYAPWDASVKVAVSLGCAAFYILSAVGIFVYFFAEDKWMKMFNTEVILKELTGESSKT